jgi:hypothetical protein
MKPLQSSQYTGRQLLNPQREYVPESHTDIRITFARIRAEQDAAKPGKKSNVARMQRK